MLLNTTLYRTFSADISFPCFILIDHIIRYTWGSPIPSHQILINGRVFTARQNCVYALKQARTPKASRYFWMDAICIDQSSTQEKNHQVGMMGQIYARSKHVLACVGPHTDDSTSLFRAFSKNRLLLASIHGLALGSTIEKPGYWVMPNPIPRSPAVAEQCLSTISFFEREALTACFIAFMKRPYFSRVWILQELHLAPATSLCCGMDRRSFAFLLAVSILIDFWINASEHRETLSNDTSAAADERSPPPWFSRRHTSCLHLQEGFHSIEAQRGCLTLATRVRGRRRLAEVLDDMQSFQCMDVRDRLFGVLALVEWGRGEPAVPDYSKDNYEVAIEVLRRYIQNPESEPVSGQAVVDWARRLCEIFQVNMKGLQIQLAITRRFGSQMAPPGILSFMYDSYFYPKPIGEFVSSMSQHQAYHNNPAWDYEGATWRQDYGNRSKEGWYGIQLRDTAAITRKTPVLGNLPLNYLYCSAHRSIRGSNSKRPHVKIMDNEQRVFGYAPPETIPSDWLLFSENNVSMDGSPMMVVLRKGGDWRLKYAMIGQASKNRDYKEKVLPLLQWTDFAVYLHAEDLLLVACMYRNLPVCSETTKYSHWLV